MKLRELVRRLAEKPAEVQDEEVHVCVWKKTGALVLVDVHAAGLKDLRKLIEVTTK